MPVLAKAPEYNSYFDKGKEYHTSDSLLYGRLHFPSSRLDALYTRRLSEKTQLMILALSNRPGALDSSFSANPSTSQGRKDNSNLRVSLQTDSGRWASEYSYSVMDGMLGLRTVRHYRLPAAAKDDAFTRFQVAFGGDVYLSALKKSGGGSIGMRLATVPSSSTPAVVSTLLINPLIGHISATYALAISSRIAAASRLHYNVYSRQSEVSAGVEYWSQPRTSCCKLRLSSSDVSLCIFDCVFTDD